MPRSTKTKKQKLPEDFKPLMWSYDFSKVDPDKDKETIIINTINYGFWKQWKWLFNYYGRKKLRKTILNLAASEFYKEPFKIMALLLNIQKMKYATRGDKIREAKGF